MYHRIFYTTVERGFFFIKMCYITMCSRYRGKIIKMPHITHQNKLWKDKIDIKTNQRICTRK